MTGVNYLSRRGLEMEEEARADELRAKLLPRNGRPNLDSLTVEVLLPLLLSAPPSLFLPSVGTAEQLERALKQIKQLEILEQSRELLSADVRMRVVVVFVPSGVTSFPPLPASVWSPLVRVAGGGRRKKGTGVEE